MSIKERIFMPCLRFTCALVALIFIFGFAIVTDAQGEKAFPTDEEIGLLPAQTDRTIQRYKPLLDEQEVQIGKTLLERNEGDLAPPSL
jgi:hypothetical protein